MNVETVNTIGSATPATTHETVAAMTPPISPRHIHTHQIRQSSRAGGTIHSTTRKARRLKSTTVSTAGRVESNYAQAAADSSSDDDDAGADDFLDSRGMGLSHSPRVRKLAAAAGLAISVDHAVSTQQHHRGSPSIRSDSGVTPPTAGLRTPASPMQGTRSPPLGGRSPSGHRSPHIRSSTSGAQLLVNPEDRSFFLYSQFGGGSSRQALAKEQSTPGPGAHDVDVLSSFPVDFTQKQLYLDRRNHQKRFSTRQQQDAMVRRIAGNGTQNDSPSQQRSGEQEEKNGIATSAGEFGMFSPDLPVAKLKPASRSNSVQNTPVPPASSPTSPSPRPSNLPRGSVSIALPAWNGTSEAQSIANAMKHASPTTLQGVALGSGDGLTAKERRIREMKLKGSVIRILSERLQSKLQTQAHLIPAPKLVKPGAGIMDDVEELEELEKGALAAIAAEEEKAKKRQAEEEEKQRRLKEQEDARIQSLTSVHSIVSAFGGANRTHLQHGSTSSIDSDAAGNMDSLALIEGAQAQINQAKVELAIHSSLGAALDSGMKMVGIGGGIIDAQSFSAALSQFLRPLGPSPFELAILERWTDAPSNKSRRRPGQNGRGMGLAETDGQVEETTQIHPPGTLARGNTEASSSGAPQADAASGKTYTTPHTRYLPLRHALPSLLVQPFQPLIDTPPILSPSSSSTGADGSSPFAAASTSSADNSAAFHPKLTNSFASMIQAHIASSERDMGQQFDSHGRRIIPGSSHGRKSRSRGGARGVAAATQANSHISTSLQLLDAPPSHTDTSASNASDLSPALAEFSATLHSLSARQSHSLESQRIHSNSLLADSLAEELFKSRSLSHSAHGGKGKFKGGGREDLLRALTDNDGKVRIHATKARSVNEHIPTKHRMEYGKLQRAMVAQERILSLRAQIAKNNQGYSGREPDHELGKHRHLAMKQSDTKLKKIIQPDLLQLDFDLEVRRQKKTFEIPMGEEHVEQRTTIHPTHSSSPITSPYGSSDVFGSTSNSFTSPSSLHSISTALTLDPSVLSHQELIALLSSGGGLDIPHTLTRHLWSNYAKDLPDRVNQLRAFYSNQSNQKSKLTTKK